MPASCCLQKVCDKQDHWVIQLVRDLKKYLVQPPAPSTFSHRMRPDCSGLDPVRSKPSKAGDCTNTLDNCSTSLSSTGERFFLITSLNYSFQILPISHPPATHCCEEPGSICLITSPSVWAGCSQVLLRPFLLQAEKALMSILTCQHRHNPPLAEHFRH